MSWSIEEAKRLLQAAEVTCATDEEVASGEYEDYSESDTRTINMNDTFGWALAMGEEVPEECLPEVARLFWNYGFHGLTYWTSKRNDWMKSEFFDVQRGIDFVRREEELRESEPEPSRRAYTKLTYTLGPHGE